jgi:parallel beta-helix repeat protein
MKLNSLPVVPEQYKKYLTKRNSIVGALTLLVLVVLPMTVYLNSQQQNLMSNAAGSASIEPENGTIAGNVTVVSDANASGGKYVKFGAAAPTPTPTAGPPANSLSIASYGATANDTTDDTTAINNTIAAAQSQGKSVYVPPGTFRYTTFRFNGITVTGAGSSSVLYAPNQASSMIILNGNGPKLTNLKVQVNGTSRTGGDHAVFVEAATNFTIDHVEVTGAASGSIVTFGSSSFGKITNNYVHDTFADGIHNTDSVHDIVVANNTVRATGDDMIAIVSYNPAQTPVTNILIQDNDVSDNTWGRGISVIGGKNVTIQRNKVGRTPCCAGIIIASESSYNTAGVSNILVKNNQLTDNSGSTGHGSILISGGNPGTTIDRIQLENNTITNPVNDSIKLEGTNSNTAILSNTMTDPENKGIYIASGSNVYCSGNTLNSNATSSPNCTGNLNFTVTGSSLTYP